MTDGNSSASADLPVRASRPVKRSFSLSGHRTSISLEAAFWDALREAATAEGASLAELVGRIDRGRGSAGLSGAVRVWVLDYYKQKAASQSSDSIATAGLARSGLSSEKPIAE